MIMLASMPPRSTILVAALAVAGAAFGQTPATQPAGDYPALRNRMAILEQQVKELQQQLATAKAENEKLKSSAGAVAGTNAAAVKPKSSNVSRCKAATNGVNFTKKDAAENLARAKKADAAIAAYLASHNVPVTIASSIYEGEIQPGMTEEEVSLITDGREFEVSKTADARTIRTQARDFTLRESDVFTLTYVNGKVYSVSREAASQSPTIGLR